MNSIRSIPFLALLTALNLPGAYAEMQLSLRSDFPGGNLLIKSNEGAVVHIAPDNRTSKPWFYWYFSAEASEPGQAEFIFEGTKISSRGPVVSTDDGQTWKWLGADQVTYSKRGQPKESFVYTFTQPGQKVRFAFSFPYLQSHLDAFLKKNAGNPYLIKSELTKSIGGRPVELLQVGQPGEGKIPLLTTARSHACETLASYVLEGLVQEAMSDSPLAARFREKYVLYCVPILDKDGVETGDQGKNRSPHDHNRDYGLTPIYPEIAAVQALADAKQVRASIDFHCPAARGDIHEAFHWMGLNLPVLKENLDEVNGWMNEERPPAGNTPLYVLSPLKPVKKIPASWYFGQRKEILLAVTLESPYARLETEDQARDYGAALLRALARTELMEEGAERTGGYDTLKKLKKTLAVNGAPAAMETLIQTTLNDPAASPVERAQANLRAAAVMQRARRYSDGLKHATAVLAEPMATAIQQAEARVRLVTIQARNPDATDQDLTSALAQFEAAPNRSSDDNEAVYSSLADHYETKGDLAKTLELTQKWVKGVKSAQYKSTALLKQADLLDAMSRGEEAAATRKELVTLLSREILPQPKGKSIMIGKMTVAFFDTLNKTPTATLEERKQAAQIVIDYPTLPASERQRVQEWMTANGGGAAPNSVEATPQTTEH